MQYIDLNKTNTVEECLSNIIPLSAKILNVDPYVLDHVSNNCSDVIDKFKIKNDIITIKLNGVKDQEEIFKLHLKIKYANSKNVIVEIFPCIALIKNY